MLRCESFCIFRIASYGITTPLLQASRPPLCSPKRCMYPGREQPHIRSNIIHVGEGLFSSIPADAYPVCKTRPVLASMYVLQPGSRKMLKITDSPSVIIMSRGTSLLPAVHANISLFSCLDFHGDRFSYLSKVAVTSLVRIMDFLCYFAALCALLVIVMTAKIKAPGKADTKWFLLSEFFVFSLYMIAFNKGCETITAATISVIIATVPVITALLVRVIYGERLSGIR